MCSLVCALGVSAGRQYVYVYICGWWAVSWATTKPLNKIMKKNSRSLTLSVYGSPTRSLVQFLKQRNRIYSNDKSYFFRFSTHFPLLSMFSFHNLLQKNREEMKNYYLSEFAYRSIDHRTRSLPLFSIYFASKFFYFLLVHRPTQPSIANTRGKCLTKKNMKNVKKKERTV